MVAEDIRARRGELAFLAVGVIFWVGIIAWFLPVAVTPGYHRDRITDTYLVVICLLLFAAAMTLIACWLLVLALFEANEIVRSDDQLLVRYVHFGERRLEIGGRRIHQLRVRLFRLNSPRAYEQALLILAGVGVAVTRGRNAI